MLLQRHNPKVCRKKHKRGVKTAGRMTANEFASYQYDAAGRITQITQKLIKPTLTTAGAISTGSTVTPVTVIYNVTYDPTGRITAFTQSGTATTATPVSSISYTYDANGNRQTSVQATTTVTGKGTTASPLVNTTTTTKTYQIDPTGNKLLGFSQTMTQTGGATSTATVSYAYDVNGALLTDGLRHYAYDSEGRLAAASLGWSSSSTKDDSITKYAHNAQAQRVFKTAPLFAFTNPPETATPSVLAAFTAFFESLWSPSTATTQKAGMSYVYDEDGTLIADTLTGGASTTWGQSAKYIYLPTASGPMPVAAIYGTKHYAIQSDHLNTPRRLIQSDGQVAWQWGYSAFGDEQPTVASNRFANTSLNQSFGTTTVSAVTFNLRYPGQYFDQESGLHYNLNRSLDTKTGRYSQSDPIGLDGGWNRFAYVSGNPLSITDSKGLNGDPPDQSGNVTTPPDTSPCIYYKKVCEEVGCKYHCNAYDICMGSFQNNQSVAANGLLTICLASISQKNLLRSCLVREDKKARNSPSCQIKKQTKDCKDGNCTKKSCIDAYHNKCFNEVGIGSSITLYGGNTCYGGNSGFNYVNDGN